MARTYQLHVCPKCGRVCVSLSSHLVRSGKNKPNNRPKPEKLRRAFDVIVAELDRQASGKKDYNVLTIVPRKLAKRTRLYIIAIVKICKDVIGMRKINQCFSQRYVKYKIRVDEYRKIRPELEERFERFLAEVVGQ